MIVFRKIDKLHRITIPTYILNKLGIKTDDELKIEFKEKTKTVEISKKEVK